MPRAELDKQPSDVAAMFDAIAARYDLLNDILSAGQVRLWRRAVARILGAGLGERVLDLAAGTGTSALTFTAAGADCVACDFSLGMLRAGHAKLGNGPRRDDRGRLGWAAGDALRLPFLDGAFDAVTISFGLRNVADPGAALRVQHDHDCPGRYALPALSDKCPARARAADRPQSGSLRIPGRVDRGLACSARAGRPHRRGRLVGGTMARPEPWRGRRTRRPTQLTRRKAGVG
jgi:SAM-dependent methyltransferase